MFSFFDVIIFDLMGLNSTKYLGYDYSEQYMK